MCVGICESVWLVVRVPGFWGGCVWVCGCVRAIFVLFFMEKYIPNFFVKSNTAKHQGFFSKLCIKLSAACVFTKKCTPYFFARGVSGCMVNHF